MIKWEYRVEYLDYRSDEKTFKDLEERLNDLGEMGWELVNFPNGLLENKVDGYAIFKKEQGTIADLFL